MKQIKQIFWEVESPTLIKARRNRKWKIPHTPL